VDSWSRTRAFAERLWSPDELALVDERVAGRTALPFERRADELARGQSE
jgi:hypothetical protein